MTIDCWKSLICSVGESVFAMDGNENIRKRRNIPKIRFRYFMGILYNNLLHFYDTL